MHERERVRTSEPGGLGYGSCSAVSRPYDLWQVADTLIPGRSSPSPGRKRDCSPAVLSVLGLPYRREGPTVPARKDSDNSMALACEPSHGITQPKGWHMVGGKLTPVSSTPYFHLFIASLKRGIYL